MRRIAGGKCCLTGKRDPCDHGVPQIAGASLLVADRHEVPGKLRRRRIKRCNPPLDLVGHDGFKGLQQCRAALSRRHYLQSEPNLQDRHGSCPDGCPGLFVQPGDYLLVGYSAHQRRKHVGVEDNHLSKDGGLIPCPRSSGISASSPTFRNKEAISVPSPRAGIASSLAASRRISRTSSSMLRPCRLARRCMRNLIPASRLRTTNWAT